MCETPVMRVAVVGHSEWVTHALGEMPRPGEITRLSDPLEEPAGGGAVSAVQVAKLGAECLFFTALGADDAGRAAARRLEAEAATVLAAVRAAPQTRALSAVGGSGDRAIAVVGEATSPRIEDPLPWDELAGCDAAYFTGHDSATLAAARRARMLVVTTRRLHPLIESGVRALLNLGHTFAHALEAETGFGAELLHGLPVHADPPIRDELLGGPTRGDSGAGDSSRGA